MLKLVLVFIFLLVTLLTPLSVGHAQGDMPVLIDAVQSDPKIYWIFNLGRAYQVGRSDAIFRYPMRSRAERESPGSLWDPYRYSSFLSGELHRAYEYGYVDYLKDLR